MILPSLMVRLHQSDKLEYCIPAVLNLPEGTQTDAMINLDVLATITMSAGLMLVLRLHHGRDPEVFLRTIDHAETLLKTCI